MQTSEKMQTKEVRPLVNELERIEKDISKELHNVMSFWLVNSHDKENGGFYNCLGEDGSVYDSQKNVWMLGRQVWTYCRLYNETERYHKPEIIEAAKRGADFLQRHAKRNDNRCYFCLTADGKPVKLQRTLFSECFYVMAMSEVARASNNAEYKNEAVDVLKSIIQWYETGNLPDGHVPLEGSAPVNALSGPMMILCIINQVCYCFPEYEAEFANMKAQAVKKILQHVQRDGKVILENVNLDGTEIAGSAGRLMNPGHALEAGWFLLEYAEETNDEQLKSVALEKFIKSPFETGWDRVHGGLFYFLDADGLSPVQLEWNMKLWWPNCEAMISFLMAFKSTKEEKYLQTFKEVLQYSFDNFRDAVNGEWYGYLNQRGSVTHNFKGGPFKGCFHVPRTLFLCQKMLAEIIQEFELKAEKRN